MDVVKLLTRSTNLSKKRAPGKDAPSVKLPSAGSSVHPQLFHDEVPESRGKKRKRNETKLEDQQDEEVDDEELDFFAQKSGPNKATKPSATDSTAQTAPPQKARNILDEDECRQILRSHRLKLTLLPPVDPPKKKSKKSSKKSKESVAKKDPKPLFPQPLVAFQDLQSTYSIASRLGENLRRQGYKEPTEVQMGSLPFLIKPELALGAAAQEVGINESSRGPNLLSIAPTGSGKTLAFLIPAINEIYQRRRLATESKKVKHSLQAVVVAPTKELATQIVNEAKKLSTGMGIKVVGMKKGMRIVGTDKEEQLRDEDEEPDSDEDEEDDSEDEKDAAAAEKKRATQPVTKADLLVTTPLMLLHALENSSPTDHHPLPTVQSLILDEADVLLDPLFREQTMGIWNACTSPHLQVTLWSATVGSNIESLVTTQISTRYHSLKLSTPPASASTVRLVVGLKDSALPTISHRLTYCATEPGKLIALRQLLHPTARATSSDSAVQSLRPPFLIFTQTIPRAMALHSELLYDIPLSAGGSSRLAVLHSSLSDSARSNIMARFRSGEIWVLITTDILSRGVDFKGVNGVVNYDVPNSAAAYIHRVGRTGRAGREGGIAVTLYTKDDIPFVRTIATVIAASERAAGIKEEDSTVKTWLLDSLPKPSKEVKKKVKLHGVESRRPTAGKSKKGAIISTKSGYERKLEHRRRGAIEGSRRRKEQADNDESGGEGGGEEWSGIE